MNKNVVLNRRTLLWGTGILGTTGLLTACGGSGSNTTSAATASMAAVGDEIKVEINEQDVANLQQGGTLTLPVLTLGPDFNITSQNGNAADNALVLSTTHANMATGLWQSDFVGEGTVNPVFCESYEAETVDGVQTIRVKLNPNAKFNDGTPIDIEALRTSWNVFKSTEGDYNIVNSGMYEFIESIEEDGDPFTVVVKMAEPFYPADSLFGSVLHPAMADPEVFNNGWTDNPNPDYGIGPFKLEEWNSAEKRFSVVPNENWLGDKPLLERITFRQMEATAARAAFRNGEIDAVGARTLAAYKDVEGTADAEPRRSLRLFSGGLNLNPARIQDVALRRAIFAGTDRKALSDIRFQGLNWTEETPGSMLLLPVSEYYQDNYPAERGVEAAQKILEDAGYTKSGDYYSKDGKNASFRVTNFGDDPGSAALAQTMIEQMKTIGIECSIDQQPDANFASVVGNKEYDMTFSGYTVGSDATSATRQYYHSSNLDGAAGSEEIDAMIAEMEKIEDDAERNAKCNEIEKKFMAEFATLGTVFNGPDIHYCKTKLANYGAAMFGSPRSNPNSWSRVGWMKS
ncbi:ABC transporter family substrate-binding protein [Rothia sp. SD9660Na]|uniref:ABC transporter family substrate-binding protein n=1 Tax=Rothia sp. SD9660Na TaxID=3047030 RepID=UPI0024BA3009|nr:ABC transporter family substrate-binding protein [Rothia sp. SD9660Na]WHS51251.1 ABC transporter family substrate-binding protein [Rothia sp. SD9660Na]